MVDGSGIVTIGTSSSTAITIGRSGITAMFPGTVTITGTTTTLQNLVVSGTCVGCGTGNFAAGGDLSGSNSSQTVIKIQGNPVSSTAPSTNQVLTWNGSFWTPANASSTGGGGSLSTSSAPVAFDFPYWSNAAGSLAGNSTIFYATSTGFIGVNNFLPARQLDIAGASAVTSTTGLDPVAIGITNTNSSTNGNYSALSFLTYDSNGNSALVGKIAHESNSNMRS